VHVRHMRSLGWLLCLYSASANAGASRILQPSRGGPRRSPRYPEFWRWSARVCSNAFANKILRQRIPPPKGRFDLAVVLTCYPRNPRTPHLVRVCCGATRWRTARKKSGGTRRNTSKLAKHVDKEAGAVPSVCTVAAGLLTSHGESTMCVAFVLT